MVQRAVLNYIKNLHTQGYSDQAIRTALLRAGYAPSDVEEAMHKARLPRVPKGLLVSAGALIGLTIIIGVILLLLPAEQQPLTITLNSYTTQTQPSGQFIVTAQIANPGPPTDVLVDSAVTGPQTIPVATQSITVRERAGVPVTVDIPLDAPPGQYTLTVTIAYNGQQITRTQRFQVQEQPLQEQPRVIPAPEEQLRSCPQGCDDLDQCTQDSCESGECIHVPIAPCCGNGICEPGEDTCVDCARPEPSVEQLARANPQEALNTCEQSPARDLCIKDVATTANDKQLCPRIQDTQDKDLCYMYFAYEGDFTICERIQNKYTRNSCYTLKNLHQYQ